MAVENKITYSVVIPVYNEAASLPALQKELEEALNSLSQAYEIIYVDDKSADASSSILSQIAEKSERVKVVTLKSHQGQSAAFYLGFLKAKGEWVITLDADLQNDPQDIKKFATYLADYDLIQGIRKKRRDGFSRRLSSQIAAFCRRLVLKDKTIDTGCSLRCFRRKCLERNFFFFRNFHRFFPYLLQIRNCRIIQIEVSHRPRQFGRSKYNNWRRFWAGVFDLGGVFWLKMRLLLPADEKD